ncbi:hypothetical protein HanPSC8_Chr06g0236841 [Helianthus annuus]|nr:hypothetical protein HanPSC8_Chr06g0236841 [Helianthus annuus]
MPSIKYGRTICDDVLTIKSINIPFYVIQGQGRSYLMPGGNARYGLSRKNLEKLV